MPYTVELMDEGEWAVGLKPDTPMSILNDIDIRTYAYSSIVITPQHFPIGTLTDADLLAQAVYTGVYLEQTDQRINLAGHGLLWWLGDAGGDNGAVYTGADATSGALSLSTQLNARVFGSIANGLTAGTINSTATTRDINVKAGTSRRQFLDTICALYASSNYEYRVNTDGTIDVNTQGALYTTNPTVVLTQDGGRDGTITGLRAELNVDTIDVHDYRTNIVVDWSSGTTDGSASNTPPTYWVDFGGDAPILRTRVASNPRTPFREKRRFNLRQNANAYAAWSLQSQTQANNLATRLANTANSYDIELTAEIDEYHPLRFVKPGDTVYTYDLRLGLTDTSNEIYYRGQAIHPTEVRIQRITAPIQEGMGVYLRRSDGAGGFEYIDLTPYVDFEDDTTVIEAGTRSKFTRKRARPKRFNRRAFMQRARQQYRLAKYLTGSPPS